MRITRPAFTLVELVIVCLICAITASVAGPRYLNAYHRYRVNAAAQRIKSDVDFARQQAVARSQTHTVRFNTSTETYSLIGVADADHKSITYMISLAGAPYSVNVSAASFGGSADLAYNLHGVPASGGTVTVQSGAYTQTVTVNIDTGRASVP